MHMGRLRMNAQTLTPYASVLNEVVHTTFPTYRSYGGPCAGHTWLPGSAATPPGGHGPGTRCDNARQPPEPETGGFRQVGRPRRAGSDPERCDLLTHRTRPRSEPGSRPSGGSRATGGSGQGTTTTKGTFARLPSK